MPDQKQYLGDGVYVDRNKWGQIELTTSDPAIIIYLEPEVYAALVAYVERLSTPHPTDD